MPSSTYNFFWKFFELLTAPVEGMIIDFSILFFMEIVKFCIVLLLVFAFGYLIFNLWNMNNETEASERLSAGLMQNGTSSFSKYPYVVELPAKASSLSIKVKQNLNSTEK